MSATSLTLTSEQYAKELGLICPICESNDIRTGTFQSDNQTAWQPLTSHSGGRYDQGR